MIWTVDVTARGRTPTDHATPLGATRAIPRTLFCNQPCTCIRLDETSPHYDLETCMLVSCVSLRELEAGLFVRVGYVLISFFRVIYFS